jgi:hypothetical protein
VRAEVCCCLQGDLLDAARRGDVGAVQRCLDAGVSINCYIKCGGDEVRAPLRPMPAHAVGVPA